MRWFLSMESSFSSKLPEKCQIKTILFSSGDYLGDHVFAPKLANSHGWLRLNQ